MVPPDERPLFGRGRHAIEKIRCIEWIDIVEEERVEVPGRSVARDLRAPDQQNPAFLRAGKGDLIGPIVVRGNIRLVRLVLDMVRDRDDVQALPPRLVHADGGPDQAIGEHRVHVQITFQGLISQDVRELNFPSGLCPQRARRQQDNQNACHHQPGSRNSSHRNAPFLPYTPFEHRPSGADVHYP